MRHNIFQIQKDIAHFVSQVKNKTREWEHQKDNYFSAVM